jgi:hypothetical protein
MENAGVLYAVRITKVGSWIVSSENSVCINLMYVLISSITWIPFLIGIWKSSRHKLTGLTSEPLFLSSGSFNLSLIRPMQVSIAYWPLIQIV